MIDTDATLLLDYTKITTVISSPFSRLDLFLVMILNFNDLSARWDDVRNTRLHGTLTKLTVL
jgi:hypothetical protein